MDSLVFATPNVQIVEQGVILDPRMSLEEYLVWCHQLFYVYEATPWMIGDTIVHGELYIGEEATQAFEERYAEQSVANMKSVCRRVPREVRRVHELSFSHHEVVAAFWADPGLQKELLQASLDNGWRRNEFRDFASLFKEQRPDVQEAAAVFNEGVSVLPPAVTKGEILAEVERILSAALAACTQQDFATVAELLETALLKARGGTCA